MSDIEKARKQLNISGYVHPTEIISNTSKVYKTLDTEKKDTNYFTGSKKSVYATFTEKTETSSNNCPTCQEDALYSCDCTLYDKQCKNGHVWYTDKSGAIKVGDPHDNE